MSVVVYKCSVCKREIELERNIRSLETVGRCIITNGCRGSLYQTKVLQDFTRGRLPDSVSGLNDWQQRKVLFNYEQVIERDEWIIEHNLGSYPAVSVFVNYPTENDPTNQEEITPDDIIIDNEDQITLRFQRPYSGVAQLVARQSDPDLLRPVEREAEQVAPPVQLSVSGEITIATLTSSLPNPTISIRTKYTTTIDTQELATYNIDDQPTLLSPWVDYDRIVVRGRVYIVRSYAGLIPRMTDGTIDSGSTFQFVGVDPLGSNSFQEISNRQVLILLASSPYDVVDKNKTQFIDVTSVSDTENPFAFYYDTGEFFAQANIVQSVYPPIRST